MLMMLIYSAKTHKGLQQRRTQNLYWSLVRRLVRKETDRKLRIVHVLLMNCRKELTVVRNA